MAAGCLSRKMGRGLVQHRNPVTRVSSAHSNIPYSEMRARRAFIARNYINYAVWNSSVAHSSCDHRDIERRDMLRRAAVAYGSATNCFNIIQLNMKQYFRMCSGAAAKRCVGISKNEHVKHGYTTHVEAGGKLIQFPQHACAHACNTEYSSVCFMIACVSTHTHTNTLALLHTLCAWAELCLRFLGPAAARVSARRLRDFIQ